MPAREWGGSLHQTFRLLGKPSASLEPFLSADGKTPEEVLQSLPFEGTRSRTGRDKPDSKRYRDGRHVYQTAGLLFEADGIVRVTELGRASRRWLNLLTVANAPVLGRHAAYALAACQLRNPSRPGQEYDEDVEVFPFAFIWRAALALDNRISSDELNRAIFRVTDEISLAQAVVAIREHRDGAPIEVLGEETISDPKKNDRIIPWIALASFGWTLFSDKRETGGAWYEIRPNCRRLLSEAATARRTHLDFDSMEEYVQHISDSAALPEDVR